jgi:hypothetical protein
VRRARIVLLSAEEVGTMAIQRQTGKGKPTTWRWQVRLMAEGGRRLAARSNGLRPRTDHRLLGKPIKLMPRAFRHFRRHSYPASMEKQEDADCLRADQSAPTPPARSRQSAGRYAWVGASLRKRRLAIPGIFVISLRLSAVH